MQDGNISPLQAFFRNKWVRIVLAIDLLAIIAVIVVLIINATKVSNIVFDVTPVDATISVNGNTSYTNGTYSITPGTYEIQISHDDLETKTFTVDIAPKHVVTISTFLAGPDDNFEFYELKANYDSLQKLIEIASANSNITTDHDPSAEEFITGFEQKMTILDLLPIKGYVYADPTVNSSTAGFTIRDGVGKSECELTACLLVNYYGSDYEEKVMETIKDAGYNPLNYQIIYERYD